MKKDTEGTMIHPVIGSRVYVTFCNSSRIVEAVAQAAAMAKSHVWAHLVDMPATQIVEFGRVVPQSGGEAAWIAALPEAEREEIEATGRIRRAS